MRTHTGTVEHDGKAAHDSTRITLVERKTSATFCSRCGDWFEPVITPCNARLEGYERIDGGTPTPVVCMRPAEHDGLHSDPRNGNPVEWTKDWEKRPHGVVDIQYGNDPKPFRKQFDEVEVGILDDLRGAAKMTGQAMGRVHPSRDVWKAIRKLDDAIDTLISGIEEGDFE